MEFTLSSKVNELPSNKIPRSDPHDGKDTSAYILRSWETLKRSTNECASLTDTKVMSHPVLYFPAGMAIPSEFADLHTQCDVQIRELPKTIQKPGDVKPEDLPAPGLLYLPNPYIVPGGRFNEMYGWDSYFILLGLTQAGLHELARGIVDNFLFEVNHYGSVLNANRTYYLTRSEPPFLAAMIRRIYENEESFSSPMSALSWLSEAYRTANRDYSTWMQEYRKGGTTGLTRYYDLDCGPVPELADDKHYFHDVIEWLLAHPTQDPGYLVSAVEDDDIPTHPGLGCNPRTGTQSAATVRGYRLTSDFYLGDRAMRESGYDSSFRFGPFCGSTHHYAPVCLNSLLYRYERDMGHIAKLLGLDECELWNQRVEQRRTAINAYLWDESSGLFLDYDFTRGRASSYRFLSTYYPLWSGLATPHQAELLRRNLKIFERPGGLAMSNFNSGMQWDEPHGFAPSIWLTVEGLLQYGFSEDAHRIAKAFVTTIDENFATDQTVREKYDVVERDIQVHVTAGYKQNVIGFGWTNGVYVMLRKLLAS